MPERERYQQRALPLEQPSTAPSLLRKEESPLPSPDPLLEEYVFELQERDRLGLPEISRAEFREILLWRDGKEPRP